MNPIRLFFLKVWGVFAVGMFIILTVSGKKLTLFTIWASILFGSVPVLAICLLSLRDRQHFKKVHRRVRRRLQAREGVSEKEFCEHFDSEDQVLAQSARVALAAFFDVSESCLHADDQFERDLEWTFFQAQMSVHVATFLLPQLLERDDVWMFPQSRPENFKDLLGELKELAERHDYPLP